jgi:hypothetical protein
MESEGVGGEKKRNLANGIFYKNIVARWKGKFFEPRRRESVDVEPSFLLDNALRYVPGPRLPPVLSDLV